MLLLALRFLPLTALGEQTELLYREEMSEIKLSVDIAMKMLQLFKVDDSKFHSILHTLENKYEAFDKRCVEIENRMLKYNQRLMSTQEFPDQNQR